VAVCRDQFLDEKHTIFGEVAEGLDTTLKEINELYCDTEGRPYR
jgi:peptidyl-prolyl cis-trans isomerase-like 4